MILRFGVLLFVFCFLFCKSEVAEAGGPIRNAISRMTSKKAETTTTRTFTISRSTATESDKYQIALASAQYRAARGIRGHVASLELVGGIRESGVGFASHDSNPATCLGRPGRTTAVCAVVRGIGGWYSTCVR